MASRLVVFSGSLALALGFLLNPSSAMADTVLPGASLEVTQPPGISGGRLLPWSFSETSSNGSLIQTAFISPDPRVSTSVTATGLGANSGINSGMLLEYYFEVIGGGIQPTPVSVDFNVAWEVDASPQGQTGVGAYADVDFLLLNGNQGPYTAPAIFVQGYLCQSSDLGVLSPLEQAQMINPSTNCGLGSALASATLDTNTIYAFGMYAAASVGCGAADCSANALSVVDPSIYIDPTNPGSADYSIVLSPGVGNPAPNSVPEPGSIGLTLAGAGLLLVIGQRKAPALPPAS